MIRALPAIFVALSAAITAVPAHADDTQAAPPTIAPPPPISGIGNPLAQAGDAAAGPFGLPDLSAIAPGVLLGQNPVPSAPGATAPAKVPPYSPFEANYLLPQYVDPAPPGKGTLAPGIGPTPDDPSTGRIAFLRRLHEMYAAGELHGALLGQQSPEEFLAAQEAAAAAADTAG